MPECREGFENSLVEKLYTREDYNELIINNPGLTVMPRCLRTDLPLLPGEVVHKEKVQNFSDIF